MRSTSASSVPNPSINAYAQSNGEAIRIVSGSTSGGAYLVTKPEITSAEDLRGKTVATPQLGNTQDVALRSWLKDQGLNTDTSGGGDVSIKPQENADTLTAFKDGSIDGAWVPEPWATRLIQEGGGKVLVDEKTLWPDGQYVTTQVIVRTKFLEQYPGTVKAIIEGELAALDFMQANPDQAKTITNTGIEKITTKPLPQQVIDAAWPNLTFTYDPIASSLEASAQDAQDVGSARPGRPQRHLRPVAAQLGARRRRACRRCRDCHEPARETAAQLDADGGAARATVSAVRRRRRQRVEDLRHGRPRP